MKRLLRTKEARDYSGVGRPTWEAVFRPRLTPIRLNGRDILWDRVEIDKIVDNLVATAKMADIGERTWPRSA